MGIKKIKSKNIVFCNDCSHYHYGLGYCDKVLKTYKKPTPYSIETIKIRADPMKHNKNNDCIYYRPDKSELLIGGILIIFIICIIIYILTCDTAILHNLRK